MTKTHWQLTAHPKFLFMGRDYPKARTIEATISRAFRKYIDGRPEPTRSQPGLRAYLGCSMEQYKAHLESTWYGDMTWANWGGTWRVAYIKPLHDFDMREEENLKQAFNYKNTIATTRFKEPMKPQPFDDPSKRVYPFGK